MSSFYLRSWNVFSWEDLSKGLKKLKNSPSFVLDCDNGKRYTFRLKEGLIWDGASIPKAFRWYLKNVDEKNLPYTSAGLLHDFCYGSECLPKNLADDLFRGVMRDAGIPRRKASFAEWCVKHFAKSHYGRKNDRHRIRFFGEMVEEECKG